MKRNLKKILTYVIPSFMLAAIIAIAVSVSTVSATYVGFADMRMHDFNDRASSLTVQGTVILYDAINYGGSSITFTNTSVPDLGAYGWNDIVSSLKVDGSVTLYDTANYSATTGNRVITFTSSPDPNEDLGTLWSQNPSLVLSQGKWDYRVWQWDTTTLYLEGPDANNYVNWSSDGLVSSRAEDAYGAHWVAVNFDQGYHRDQEWDPNLGDIGWNNKISSLRVQGTATLYDGTNYSGSYKDFTGPRTDKSGWVPDLGTYGWNDIASSIHTHPQTTVSFFESTNYGGAILTRVCPAYQPPLLSVSSTNSITLEGVDYNWYNDVVAAPSWTGAKFDVWAVENRGAGKKLMLELYFIRTGANLAWNPERTTSSGDVYNLLMAIDVFPQYAQRIIHPGDIARWKIDVRALVQRGANYHGLDFNNLKIAQISYTLESGSNILFDTPAIGCKLQKLRLAYT
jgi:hypothetical protein